MQDAINTFKEELDFEDNEILKLSANEVICLSSIATLKSIDTHLDKAQLFLKIRRFATGVFFDHRREAFCSQNINIVLAESKIFKESN